MAQPKYDGVVESVHYNPEGQVDWVRAYLRRGPTFSDYILLKRQTLIEHLRAGKKYMAGRRVKLMASTFEVSAPIKVVSRKGKEFLLIGPDSPGEQDRLNGVPLI